MKPCSDNEKNIKDNPSDDNFHTYTVVALDVNALQLVDEGVRFGYFKNNPRAGCLVLGIGGDPATVVRNMLLLAFDAVQLYKYGELSDGISSPANFEAMRIMRTKTLSAILRSFKFGYHPFTIIHPKLCLAIARMANSDDDIMESNNVLHFTKLQTSKWNLANLFLLRLYFL